MKLRRSNLFSLTIVFVFVAAVVYNYITFMHGPFTVGLRSQEFPPYRLGWDEWTATQLKRLETLRAFCFPDGLKKQSLKPIRSDTRFSNELFYNDEYRVIFCHVPKVASSNWRLIFQDLNSIKTINDSVYTEQPIRLSNLTSTEQLWRLATYRKFLFVRHPFERLLSAYIDKLRDSYNSSIYKYQRKLGSQILKKYRPEASEQVIESGNDVTFAEFVQYLTDLSSVKDPHWRPMSESCRPCDIAYDFIGKFESMDADVPIILKKLGIELPFQFPPKEGPKANYTSSTSVLLSSHMKQLTKKQIDNIYKIYRDDFEMFGYDYLDWKPK